MKYYAQLALEAYSAKPDIGQHSASGRAIVRPTPDGQCFAFPGTDNLACWLADLDCGRTTTILGKVHAGFNAAARDIYASVRAIVEPGAILCGHSEGAALALLIAGLLVRDGKHPAMVFAFEPPQCSTDSVLEQTLNEGGVRVVLTRKGNDVVPMIPRMLFDWRHPGKLLEIGSATLPIWNVEDHAMKGVLAAL